MSNLFRFHRPQTCLPCKPHTWVASWRHRRARLLPDRASALWSAIPSASRSSGSSTRPTASFGCITPVGGAAQKGQMSRGPALGGRPGWPDQQAQCLRKVAVRCYRCLVASGGCSWSPSHACDPGPRAGLRAAGSHGEIVDAAPVLNDVLREQDRCERAKRSTVAREPCVAPGLSSGWYLFFHRCRRSRCCEV